MVGCQNMFNFGWINQGIVGRQNLPVKAMSFFLLLSSGSALIGQGMVSCQN